MKHENINMLDLRGRGFLKMHGLGNDFAILDGRDNSLALNGQAVRRLADRHIGIGCDQLIVLERPTQGGDVRMRIWNSDGAEVESCGNATRCVARIVMESNGRDHVLIETAGGVLRCNAAQGGMIAVDMGKPAFEWQRIPLARSADTRLLDYARGGLSGPAAVNVGNPHLVFFVEDPDVFDLGKVGPEIEHDSLFPERINVSLARIEASDRLRLRVWERGAGLTLACGTAACAAVVCAASRGLSARQASVVLPGGSLVVHWRESDGHIVMTGPAALSFQGEIGADLLDVSDFAAAKDHAIARGLA